MNYEGPIEDIPIPPMKETGVGPSAPPPAGREEEEETRSEDDQGDEGEAGNGGATKDVEEE